MDQDVVKVLETAAACPGLYVIVSPPKVGLTHTLTASIQHVTAESKDVEVIKPVTTASKVIWDQALTKYHGNRDGTAKSTGSSTTAIKQSLEVRYVDLRGIFQRSLLLLALCDGLGLPMPDSQEAMAQALQAELSRCSPAYNLLVIDHLSRQAAQELVDAIDFSCVCIGVVLACGLVVDLQDALLSEQVTLDELIHQSPAALSRYEQLVTLEFQAYADLLHGSEHLMVFTNFLAVRDIRALIINSVSIGVLTSMQNTAADEYAERVNLILDLSGGVPGVVASLCHVPLSLLQHIAANTDLTANKLKLKLSASKLTQAARCCLTVMSLYYVMLFTVDSQLSAALQFMQEIVSCYRAVYSLATGNKVSIRTGYEQLAVDGGLPQWESLPGSYLPMGVLARPGPARIFSAKPTDNQRDVDVDVIVIPQFITTILSYKCYLNQTKMAFRTNPYFLTAMNTAQEVLLPELIDQCSVGNRAMNLSFSLQHSLQLQLAYDSLLTPATVSARSTANTAFVMLLLAGNRHIHLFNTIHEKVLLAKVSLSSMPHLHTSADPFQGGNTSLVHFSYQNQTFTDILSKSNRFQKWTDEDACALLLLDHFNTVLDILGSILNGVQNSIGSNLLERVTNIIGYAEKLHAFLTCSMVDYLGSAHCQPHTQHLYHILQCKYKACSVFLRLLPAHYETNSMLSFTPADYMSFVTQWHEIEEYLTAQWNMHNSCSTVLTVYQTLVNTIARYNIEYDNIIAYQNKILLHQLLVNQQHFFYRTHTHLLVLNLINDPLSFTVSVLDTFMLLRNVYQYIKPTMVKFSPLFNQMASNLDLGGSDEMVLFQTSSPSPHTPRTPRTPRTPHSPSLNPSNVQPVYLDSCMTNMLQILAFVKSNCPKDSAAHPKHLQCILLHTYLSFALTTNAKDGLAVLADNMSSVNAYINYYLAALLDSSYVFESTVLAHNYYGLAVYLYLLHLHSDPDRPIDKIKHKLVYKLEQYLNIYHKYAVTNHHKLFYVLLSALLLNVVMLAKYSYWQVETMIQELMQYRAHILGLLADRADLYQQQSSSERFGSMKETNLIYTTYREKVYLIQCYLYLQHCLQLVGQYLDQLKRHDEAIHLFTELVYSYQSQHALIHGIIFNKAFNQNMQPEDNNISLEIAVLFVHLGSVFYEKAILLSGNTYKYVYKYMPNTLSIFPAVTHNDVADASTLFISFKLYTIISKFYKYAAYLYDFEYLPKQSAPYIYRIFKLITALHCQQQLYGICKVYYDSILKLCTEVSFLDTYEIMRLYREYGQILLLNTDYDEAMVIYSLVINEYKNYILQYCHNKYPEDKDRKALTLPGKPMSIYLDDMPIPLNPMRAAVGNPLEHAHTDPQLHRYYEEMLDCVVCKCQIYITTKAMKEAQEYIQFALQRFIFLYSSDPITSKQSTSDGPLRIDVDLLSQINSLVITKHNVSNLMKILSIFCSLHYAADEYSEALVVYHMIFQLLMIKCTAAYTDVHLIIHKQQDIVSVVSDKDMYNTLYSNIKCESKEMSRLLHNIGLVLFAMGKMNEAKDALERALAILLRRFSDEYVQMLSVLDALISVLKELEREKEVEELVTYSAALLERMDTQASAGAEHMHHMERTVEGDAIYELDWRGLLGNLLEAEHSNDDDDNDEESERGYIYKKTAQKHNASSSIIDEEAGQVNGIPRAPSADREAAGGAMNRLRGLQQLFFPAQSARQTPLQAATRAADGKQGASIFTTLGDELELGAGVGDQRGSKANRFRNAAGKVKKRGQTQHIAKGGQSKAGEYDSDASDMSDAENRRQRVERTDSAHEGDDENQSSGCTIA